MNPIPFSTPIGSVTDLPEDSAPQYGFQSYMNLDSLTDWTDKFLNELKVENTAQSWMRQAAEQPTLPLETLYIQPDTRSPQQRMADLGASRGLPLTGSDYLRVTGKIDARAKPAAQQLANEDFKDDFFASRRPGADPSQINIAFENSAASTEAGRKLNQMIQRNRSLPTAY